WPLLLREIVAENLEDHALPQCPRLSGTAQQGRRRLGRAGDSQLHSLMRRHGNIDRSGCGRATADLDNDEKRAKKKPHTPAFPLHGCRLGPYNDVISPFVSTHCTVLGSRIDILKGGDEDVRYTRVGARVQTALPFA